MIRSSIERFRYKVFGSSATRENDKLAAVLRDVSFNAPGSLGRLLRSFSPGHVQLALRSAVKSQYLGNNQILCQILGNKKMFVIGDDLGFSPHMIMEGYWEYWLTRYFAQRIRPGDTVIDIGANLGYYSILAADLVTSTGKVVSIEANPHVFSLLSKSMVLNGYDDRAELHNFALASKDETGTRNFFVPYNEPKNGTLLSENENIKWREKHGDVFKVDLGYLDPDQFARVDFIKVDVEGAELSVLQSLRPLIDKFRPKLVCEVNFGRGYQYEDIQEAIGTSDELKHLTLFGEVVPLTKAMVDEQTDNEDWLICWP